MLAWETVLEGSGSSPSPLPAFGASKDMSERVSAPSSEVAQWFLLSGLRCPGMGGSGFANAPLKKKQNAKCMAAESPGSLHRVTLGTRIEKQNLPRWPFACIK